MASLASRIDFRDAIKGDTEALVAPMRFSETVKSIMKQNLIAFWASGDPDLIYRFLTAELLECEPTDLLLIHNLLKREVANEIDTSTGGLNLGLRISDILRLHLADIVRDGDRFRLDIVEQKTGKHRVFTVPLVIQQYVENYCLRNGIKPTEQIFPITERAVQKQIKLVCDYLGYNGISTHSFRKWYATEIYKNNGYDITLVQRLLQHSSAAVTQRYIGLEPQRIEQAIEGHATLI